MQAFKQEILEEMRKEMDKMKQDILEGKSEMFYYLTIKFGQYWKITSLIYMFLLSLQLSGLNQVGGNLPIKSNSTNRAPATQGYCMTVVITTWKGILRIHLRL